MYHAPPNSTSKCEDPIGCCSQMVHSANGPAPQRAQFGPRLRSQTNEAAHRACALFSIGLQTDHRGQSREAFGSRSVWHHRDSKLRQRQVTTAHGLCSCASNALHVTSNAAAKLWGVKNQWCRERDLKLADSRQLARTVCSTAQASNANGKMRVAQSVEPLGTTHFTSGLPA